MLGAVIAYVVISVLYVAATATYVAGVIFAPHLREPGGIAFAVLFGIYIASTILLASRLARNVMREGHSRFWIAGFLLFGGVVIPVYQFVRRPVPGSSNAPLPGVLAADAYVILALAHASWTIMIALTSVPMTRGYTTLAATDTFATWAVWFIAIAGVLRLRWSGGRKLLWSAFIVLLPFVAAPLRYHAFRT